MPGAFGSLAAVSETLPERPRRNMLQRQIPSRCTRPLNQVTRLTSRRASLEVKLPPMPPPGGELVGPKKVIDN